MGINIGKTNEDGHYIGNSEIVQSDDLKLYLNPYDFASMGNDGGSTIYDLSAEENDFTLINDVQNRTDGHWSFDGTNDFAYLNDDSDFDSTATDDFTIQLWVKVTNNSDNSWFFSKISTHNTLYLNKGYHFFYHKDLYCCVFGLSAADGVSNYNSVVSVIGTTDIYNNWANVAISVDRSGNAIMYVNGVQEVSTSVSALSAIDCSNSKKIYIGGKSTSGTDTSTITNSCTGYIGPIWFYKKALSVDEINQNFNTHRGIYGI